MTTYPNLLPQSVLARRAKRRRVRQWVAVGCIEVILLAAVCVGLRLGMREMTDGVEAAVLATRRQIDDTFASTAKSQQELAVLKRRMAVTAEVARHPDWSIVLAIIAKHAGREIKLTTCQLVPGAEAAQGQTEFRVSMIGRCPTQGDLSRFVRELTDAGVFASVKVQETRAADTGTDAPALQFTLNAMLTEGGSQ